MRTSRWRAKSAKCWEPEDRERRGPSPLALLARDAHRGRMVRKVDRIATVFVSAAVGLQALIPGWQIMSHGSVYGFKLPATWLSSYWPFEGFFVAGLVLVVVVGGGCVATAVVNLISARAGAVAGLLMGLVLVGWIAGELTFMTQTMVMTWVILGSGIALVALSAPYALPELRLKHG